MLRYLGKQCPHTKAFATPRHAAPLPPLCLVTNGCTACGICRSRQWLRPSGPTTTSTRSKRRGRTGWQRQHTGHGGRRGEASGQDPTPYLPRGGGGRGAGTPRDIGAYGGLCIAAADLQLSESWHARLGIIISTPTCTYPLLGAPEACGAYRVGNSVSFPSIPIHIRIHIRPLGTSCVGRLANRATAAAVRAQLCLLAAKGMKKGRGR